MIILFPIQNLKTLTLAESGVLHVANGVNTVVVISIQKTQLHLRDEEETLSSWGGGAELLLDIVQRKKNEKKKHITKLNDLMVRTERKKHPWVKGEPVKFSLTLSLKFLSVMLTGGLPGSWKIRKSLLQGEKIYSVRKERKKKNQQLT